MSKFTNTMTAQQPSFGMPWCAAFATPAPIGSGVASRVRHLGVDAVVTTDAAYGKAAIVAVKGAFPRTRAWRPPTC